MLLMLCVSTAEMVMVKMIRTYSELSKLKTFEERFAYLKLQGSVGEDTFGYDRYLNQLFYRSQEWRSLRDLIIVRDNGCDLGVEGFEIIKESIYIHHMNPITKEDVIGRTESLLNPEFLISTRFVTHNAIHYGDENAIIILNPVERTRNDTCPWKQK